MSDPIADLIIRIKNAQDANQSVILIPHSNFKLDILNVMKKDGVISDARVISDKKSKIIEIYLGSRQISNIKRLSKPGRRYYVKAGEIPRPLRGLGLVIMSTPRGVLSGLEARKLNVGGELICEVW